MIACLWDIDGTLLASGGAGKAAMDAALAAEFGIHTPIVYSTMTGRTDRGIAGDQFALHNIPNTPENWERFIKSYLRFLPEKLIECQGTILPGVMDTLKFMTTRTKVRVGLLTGNLPRGAQVKLGYFGLAEFFAFGAFGDKHLLRDDVAREALQAVHERCGKDASLDRVFVVGDTPLDVACARAIGAQAVAVATGHYTMEQLAATKPDLLLADLSDPTPLWKLARDGG